MKPFTAAVLALSCLAPLAAFAQATDSGSYTYCWVKDTDKNDIWLSQVFPTPPGAEQPDAALATEFRLHVGTLGGTGDDKLCVTTVAREAAESKRRAEVAAIMRKRSFGIRIYDLHEVNWTPAAASHAGAAPAPMAAPAIPAAPATAPAPAAIAPVAAPAAVAVAPAAPPAPVAVAPVAPPAPPAVAPVAPPATPAVAPEPPAVPAAAKPGKPASVGIDRQIASEAFFQLPAGKGAPLYRSGSRIVNKSLPVASDSTMRRVAGSNQCHLEQTVLAGEGGKYKTTASGETWAGFIPLTMSSKMSSQRGVINSMLKAVSIEKTEGRPFPLIAGNSFGWSVSYESINNSADIARYGQDWRCTVGASAPASTSIPGMEGEQTEVQCRLSFVSLPAPPQDQVFVWYDAAGCFMQDPTR